MGGKSCRSDNLTYDNGHRQRQNQHNNNNKRGRARNNRRPNGNNNYNNNGGNAINRVYESNGPDVKVRGTAQTIAEKYMQLARDAHSAGDIVMAESYYQFAEHYYRVLAAAQPAGQPVQSYRRDEEGEDEANDGGEEDTAETPLESGEAKATSEANDELAVEGTPRPTEAERNESQRNNRPRERYQPRWQNRRPPTSLEDTNREREGENAPEAEVAPRLPPPRVESQQDHAPTGEAWEAPSFLRRPAPIVTEAEVRTETVAPEGEAAPVERRPRTRRPRAVATEVAADDIVPRPTDD